MHTLEVSTTTAVRTLTNYIDGQWVPSQTSDWLPVTNPATGEILAQVPLSTSQEVDQAVQAAQRAFQHWRAVPPLERARALFALRELLCQHRAELARLITTEQGKTLADAQGEVQRAIENVEVASGIPSLLMGYGLEQGAGRDIDEAVVRRPLGVFAAITPFNFPLMVPFWFLPYALATGNTFIIKPSEQVPLTLQFTFELLAQLGLPPGGGEPGSWSQRDGRCSS